MYKKEKERTKIFDTGIEKALKAFEILRKICISKP